MKDGASGWMGVQEVYKEARDGVFCGDILREVEALIWRSVGSL